MAFFAGDLRGRGAHPAEARKIAHAGRVWAERYWRYSDMQVCTSFSRCRLRFRTRAKSHRLRTHRHVQATAGGETATCPEAGAQLTVSLCDSTLACLGETTTILQAWTLTRAAPRRPHLTHIEGLWTIPCSSCMCTSSRHDKGDITIRYIASCAFSLSAAVAHTSCVGSVSFRITTPMAPTLAVAMCMTR